MISMDCDFGDTLVLSKLSPSPLDGGQDHALSSRCRTNQKPTSPKSMFPSFRKPKLISSKIASPSVPHAKLGSVIIVESKMAAVDLNMLGQITRLSLADLRMVSLVDELLSMAST